VGRRRSLPHLTPTLSAPKGGEGEIELSAYCFQHAADVFHYISVPETHHAIASPGDLQAASLVCAGSKSVLPAIDLNDQLRCRTGEINNVSTNWMLTTKSVRKPQLA
jgi:hypothetical protein